MPEPESPECVSIPKVGSSERHKYDNPLFCILLPLLAFLSLPERYTVFPLINNSFLSLFQTSQIQSHILMQSLKVGSKERYAVTQDILTQLVLSEAKMSCEHFGKCSEGLLLVADSTAHTKNNYMFLVRWYQ